MKTETSPPIAKRSSAHLQPAEKSPLRRPDFVKIEKNLISLGFFTPSSNRIKGEKAKTITFTRFIDGKRIEASATIVPASLYGLPVTADQDKYLALQKIIGDLRQETGEINNPVTFTSTEILRLLDQVDSGKNYKEISEWLDLMSSTTIISEGTVYLAGKKAWVRDRFHVFDRAISSGKEIEPGRIAEKNYVWLSSWQLENINNNYLLPIDFDAYKILKNHIAKALVPLLQVWLFATRTEGVFEKRYDEICQLLRIRKYTYLSEIIRNFTPSLDELKEQGYLADWKIEKTSDKKNYKIIFRHGEKFHKDLLRRLSQKQDRPVLKVVSNIHHALEQGSRLPPEEEQTLVSEMTARGITERRARLLLTEITEGQPVMDQLEWGDHLIAQSDNFQNPPGFFVSIIRDNIIPPDTFISSRKRQLYEDARKAQQQRQQEQTRLELAFEEYRRAEIDNYIATQLSEPEGQVIRERIRADLLKRFSLATNWTGEQLQGYLEAGLRSEVAKQISFIPFDAFCQKTEQAPSPD